MIVILVVRLLVGKYFLCAGADPLSNPDDVSLLKFLSVDEGVVDGPNAGQWNGEE